jgi:hypothetical protein
MFSAEHARKKVLEVRDARIAKEAEAVVLESTLIEKRILAAIKEEKYFINVVSLLPGTREVLREHGYSVTSEVGYTGDSETLKVSWKEELKP